MATSIAITTTCTRGRADYQWWSRRPGYNTWENYKISAMPMVRRSPRKHRPTTGSATYITVQTSRSRMKPWQPTWASFASVSLAAHLDSLNRQQVSKRSCAVWSDKSQRTETPLPAKHAGLKLIADGAMAWTASGNDWNARQ